MTVTNPEQSWEETLRNLARQCMRGQQRRVTLQTTLLVNEAWIRLDRNGQGESMDHLSPALAARAIHSALIDLVRRRAAAKRGGGVEVVPIDEDSLASEEGDGLLEIAERVEQLATVDSQLHQVAVLRLYGGYRSSEIARELQVSERTAERAWALARAWLGQRLDA